MQYGLMVAALVRLYSAVRNKEWDVVEKLVFVIVVGFAAGYFGIHGITVENGIVGGLATSGVFTGISYVGEKARLAMWDQGKD